jgi:hypothetical protein
MAEDGQARQERHLHRVSTILLLLSLPFSPATISIYKFRSFPLKGLLRIFTQLAGTLVASAALRPRSLLITKTQSSST